VAGPPGAVQGPMTTVVAGDSPDWIGATDASADTLLKTTSAVSVANYIETVNVGKSYRAVIMTVEVTGYSGEVALNIWCYDAAGDQSYRSLGTVIRGVAAAESQQWIMPCPASAGGQIKIQMAPVSGSATFTSVVVVGSTNDLSAIYGPTRSDGRPYPVGQSAANDQTVTSATLIAGPGAGRRIMLMSLFTTLPSAVISGEVIVQGTVGGTLVDLLVCAINANANGMIAVAPIPPQGLLLDDNTGVSVVKISTAAQRTNAVYDTVS